MVMHTHKDGHLITHGAGGSPITCIKALSWKIIVYAKYSGQHLHVHTSVRACALPHHLQPYLTTELNMNSGPDFIKLHFYKQKKFLDKFLLSNNQQDTNHRSYM